jgi:hypothetical protein
MPWYSSLTKLSYLAAIIAAVGAIIFGIDEMVDRRTRPEKSITRTDTVTKHDTTVKFIDRFPKPATKKAFLGIKTSGEPLNYHLAQQLNEFYTGLGYPALQNAAGAEKNFHNVVDANLVIGEIKSAETAETKKYSVILTLRFYNGASTNPCATSTYSEQVTLRNSEPKSEITRQAIPDLVTQVTKDTTIPLCIPK